MNAIANYTATYANDLELLEKLGADEVRIEELGGGDVAVHAAIDGHLLIGGNMQPGLFDGDTLKELLEDGEEIEWSVGLYADDELIYEGFGDTLVAATVNALAAKERGETIDQ